MSILRSATMWVTGDLRRLDEATSLMSQNGIMDSREWVGAKAESPGSQAYVDLSRSEALTAAQ
jgi:hypothetical protein